MLSAKFPWRTPIIITLLLALVLAATVACGDGEEALEPGLDHGTAQNVILLIGDGMGTPHRTAARLYSVGREGQLVMDTLPIAGMSRTWSTESVVTDSAAAGTALATGIKTYNKAISVDPAGNPVETILEKAQEAGKSVGLVTDVQIAHATPAVFAAHNADRDDYLGIALDMFDHDVDVMLAGGEDHFLPEGTAGCYPEDGQRTDGRNLIDEAIAKGYEHVCTEADFNVVDPEVTDRLWGTFGDLHMVQRPFTPSVADMTAKAIAILSKNPEGFFLMVEGGQLDWASHANDALNTLGDTLAFDEAVAIALDFQAENPDTLVIVTADHTTGGLTIEDVPQDEACPNPRSEDPRECMTAGYEDGPFEEGAGQRQSFWLDWTSGNHTAEEVPVTAIGPHAIDLAGYYENTYIFEVMRDAMALDLPE